MSLVLMRVPIEAHANGGQAQHPWVAEIRGPSLKYGLDREFVRPHNDWKDAHVAWSGNVYGRTAQFALRDGRLYEVGRYRGSGSKLHWVREFVRVANRQRTSLKPEELLDAVEQIPEGTGVTFTAPEDQDNPTTVARIVRLGSTISCAFVVREHRWQAAERVFRLQEGGLYEIRCGASTRLVEVIEGERRVRTQQEALTWLSTRL